MANASPTRRRRRSPGHTAALIAAAAVATTNECVILDGYAARPHHRLNGRMMFASRAVWIIANGDPGERWVLHTCGRGEDGCINIRHLYLGDHFQNMRDAARDGVMNRGEANRGAKLTADDVCTIRRRYAAGGVSQRRLAAEYGVEQPAISDIIRRRKWAWLDCA